MAMIDKVPGLRALSGDGLANAHHLEEITALLLSLNRIHRGHASIKFTGI
jgi:predicted dinucleotide-binding enzyme